MSNPTVGRPTIFNQTLTDEICARIADGESLRGICRDETMPTTGTVLRWLTEPDKAAFRDQYTQARDAQADALVEECLEIADDGTNDWMAKENSDGQNVGWTLNGEHVNRSRLRVDTRKWWAARLAPKKYGDKQEVIQRSEISVTVEDRRSQIEGEIVEILQLSKPVN